MLWGLNLIWVNQGVLVLAEVALGKCYEAKEAEDLSFSTLQKKKEHCQSTHGLGRMAAAKDQHHVT